VNPEARYGKEGVSVMPGPGGGHVWPPWSYNPTTGLVYIPSTIGGAYNYQANPDFVPFPTEIGASGRGQMNMGTATAGRGGRGAGAAAAPGGPPPPAPTPLPAIGPEGRGNVLVAWDPVAKKEKWRGLAAGFNQGGTLATAGNLVFSSVNTRLLAYRADTGEQVLDLATGLSQMGPPMTFMLDGKQYVAVAGGPPAVPGAGRGGGGAGGGGGAPPAGGTPGLVPQPAAGAAPAAPGPPSKLLVLVLDGKPLPAAPAPVAR
jgi:quinohemoprotein ethanol dehydrogenase